MHDNANQGQAVNEVFRHSPKYWFHVLRNIIQNLLVGVLIVTCKE